MGDKDPMLRTLILLSCVFWLVSGCAHKPPNIVAEAGHPDGVPAVHEADKETNGGTQDCLQGSPVQEESGSENIESPDMEIFPPAGACPREDEQPQAEGSEQALLDSALELCKSSQEFWAAGELDKAIDALDQAYGLILKVDPDGDPDLNQQKDDLRFLISKRLLEIHASRFTAVTGIHKAIPLVMNKYVKQEIKNFQTRERRFFLDSYKRSGRYRQEIVKALSDAGLPEELSWLPLIESGFKVRALSRARALGLWQFIPSTGYKFGLKRDVWIDERLDPEKSTKAAIAYMNELHKIFGDWTTVLAAYNCGEGTVLKAIRRQRINYLDNFWDLYSKLPMETARYVPRFLATLHIIKNPEKYGFKLPKVDPSYRFERVKLDRQLSLGTVAVALGISPKVLKDLNPELRYSVTPDEEYELRVPAGKASILLAKLDSLKVWSPPHRYVLRHRVRRGETLSVIAKRYGSSVRAIMMANNLHSKHFIRAGKLLKVPVGKRKVASLHRGERQKGLLPGGRYVVQKGDSLWLIARRFRVSTNTLRRINNLSSNCIYVGQILKIRPVKRAEFTSSVGESQKVVAVGDNLS